MWGLVGGSCSGFWRVGSRRALLADKGLSLEMVKIALWFIEQALFGDFALLNLLTSSGDLSQDAHSMWEGQAHIPHVCRWGAGAEVLRGESMAVGCQQGLPEELDLDLSLDALRFDREKSEGAEKTPWTHPAGPGNCVIKVLRETAQGWEVSPPPAPDPKIKQALCHCPGARGSGRGPGREINDDTFAALWGEAGMAPGGDPSHQSGPKI